MKNSRVFLCENFQFLEVKFSIYLNRRVIVMLCVLGFEWQHLQILFLKLVKHFICELRGTCYSNNTILTQETEIKATAKKKKPGRRLEKKKQQRSNTI